jgi:hypothetical protein
MVCGSYRGQVLGLFLSALGGGRAGFEAEAVITGFHDVVGEAVEHGGRHLGVADHVGMPPRSIGESLKLGWLTRSILYMATAFP